MSFTYQKGEFDRCFNRLDRPVEESRPDRFPFLPQWPPAAEPALTELIICLLLFFCVYEAMYSVLWFSWSV